MKSGLYCSAGYNWISIGSEGRVYTCNAMLYTSHENTYLGNIIKEDIILRNDEFGFRCPTQECFQYCDRHWARKQIYKDGVIVDSQDFDNPNSYNGLKRPMTILFAPTWKCNYSCKYCCLPGSDFIPNVPDACNIYSAEEWISGFDKFLDINKIDGGIWMTNGGEPLFYNGIDKLFKYFYSKNFRISLTTNLSSDIYNTIINSAPPECFGMICCSLHVTDKNFKWELFKNRIQLLKSFGYQLQINYVGIPDQIMLVPEYSDWCKSIGVKFVLIPLLGNRDGMEFKSISDYPEPLKTIIYQYSITGLLDGNRFVEGTRLL
jgi:radical SAM protein with 4Fe4S-binding SPASM domain